MKGMQTTAREPAWKGAALLTGGFVVVLWVLEIFDAATGNPLDAYGTESYTVRAIEDLVRQGNSGDIVLFDVTVTILGFPEPHEMRFFMYDGNQVTSSE